MTRSETRRHGRTGGHPGESAGPSDYEARFFGAFRAGRDGVPLSGPHWGRAGAQTLLKWFLLHPGVPFSNAALAALLPLPRGGGDDANRLHVSIHALRRVLEPELPRRRPSTFILIDDAGRYRFETRGRWRTDVQGLECLSAQARDREAAGDHAAAVHAYEQMLRLLRRGFLPEDIYDDAFAEAREGYERRHDEVLRRALALYSAHELHYETLACGLEILERDPYDEQALTAVVGAHLRQGTVTAARAELERFVRTLENDLGLPPGPGLRELGRRVASARGGSTPRPRTAPDDR